MTSKALIRVITVLVFAVVIGTPLFYQKTGVFPYTLSKALFFQAIIEIVFAFWLVLIIFDKTYRPKLTPLLLALGGFLAALLLTAFTGADPWRSFWSIYERGFGVFTILHLGALAVVLSSLGKKFSWGWLFYASLGTAFFVSILAMLQTAIPHLLLEEPMPDRPGATFGNPAFLAGYLLFHAFLAAYFLLNKIRSGLSTRKNIAICVYFAVALVAISGVLFLTQTRGDIFGFGAAVFVLLVLFSLRPPEIGIKLFARRKLYVMLIVVVIVSGSLFWLTRGNNFWARIPGLNRFYLISLTSESLQPRIIAARAAWRGFLDNPILGVGWDNFNIVFNKYYDPASLRASYQETRFDKPHNFILEDLVSGGILLLLAHSAIFGAFIYQAARIKNRLFGQIMTAAVAGYIARSLFIFDTIGPALALYIFLGYVDAEFRERSINVTENITESESEGNIAEERVSFVKIIPVIIFSIAFAYFVNIRVMKASNFHFRGFTYMARGDVDASIENFRSALNIWNPYAWNFVRDYAAVIAETYFYNPGSISPNAVLEAIKEMELVRDEHPRDAYNHYFLVDLYNQTSDIDKDAFLEKAEREAEIALELSPNRQQILFSLAKTKTLQGDYKAAVELAKRALALDDKVADSHFYYGLLSFVQGDEDTGYIELKKAVAMGKKFKSFYEPQTIANFFADYGKIEEAVKLYKIAYDMRPGDLEVTIKLGVAYFFVGDREHAKEFLELAGKDFDFQKSPALAELKPILDDLRIAY